MPAHSIETAVRAATNFFDKLYEKEDFTGILLEEVREHPSDESWEITIGYDRHVSTGPAQLAIQGASTVREYKVITVRKSNGAVESMVIREASRR